MAIVLNGTPSVTAGNSASFTFSHTVTTGKNQKLVFGAGVRTASASIVSAVTFSGVSLTNIGLDLNANTNSTSSVWVLQNPFVGTANVVVTMSATVKAVVGAITYDGVDSIGASGNSSSGGGTTTPVSGNLTTTADNSLIFDNTGWKDSGITLGAATGWTQQWQSGTTGNPAAGNANGRGSDQAAATVANYTFVATPSSSVAWTNIMMELKPKVSTATNQFIWIGL